MIVNKCSEILLAKSKKLYGNYRDNCTVVQRMLEKYKKIYPNIFDYSIMHFIDIAEFCDLTESRRQVFQKMDYKSVKISEDARIARQSVVIGDVTIGRDSCVLHYAVIRGDDAPIVIGEESNVQENCTIHVSRNMPVHIGNNVTVGHNAVLHGCMIGDRTLIGMGAVVLDGARIGKDCIIGAGSLVTKNTVIPDGSLVMGSPAKIKRNLTWEEKLGNLENSKEYVSVSAEMQKQGVL